MHKKGQRMLKQRGESEASPAGTGSGSRGRKYKLDVL